MTSSTECRTGELVFAGPTQVIDVGWRIPNSKIVFGSQAHSRVDVRNFSTA